MKTLRVLELQSRILTVLTHLNLQLIWSSMTYLNAAELQHYFIERTSDSNSRLPFQRGTALLKTLWKRLLRAVTQHWLKICSASSCQCRTKK